MTSELGLLDAETIYDTMMVLKDRDPKPKSNLEKKARFLFVEELEQKAKKQRANVETNESAIEEK